MNDTGLNVFGHLDGGFGLARTPRYFLKAFDQEKFPFCVRNVPSQNALSEKNMYQDSEKLSFPINLYFLNHDSIKGIKRSFPSSEYEKRYEIGVWFWELEDFPSFFHSSFEMLDELWVCSDYVYESLRKSSPVPVFKVPFPYEPPFLPGHSDLFDEFTFLFVFDFNSDFYRKNPLGAAMAFSKAFANNEKVRLILKSSNGDKFPELKNRLQEFCKTDPRILCVDEVWSREKLNESFLRSHAFISLHRSEGLGLNILDALALDRPCVVSAYGGNMEFMDPAYPYLVSCKRVPIEAELEFYRIPSFWGEPDMEEAARKMKSITMDYDKACLETRLLKEKIFSSWTPLGTVQWVRKRLGDILDSDAFTERIRFEKKVPAYHGLNRSLSGLKLQRILFFSSCRKERLLTMLRDFRNLFPRIPIDIFGRQDSELQSEASGYYVYPDSGFYDFEKVDFSWFENRRYSLIVIPYFNYLGKGYENIHAIARAICSKKRIGIGIEGDVLELEDAS